MLWPFDLNYVFVFQIQRLVLRQLWETQQQFVVLQLRNRQLDARLSKWVHDKNIMFLINVAADNSIYEYMQ